MTSRSVAVLTALAILPAGMASADTVSVRLSGVVEFNLINSGPFATVEEGDSAVATFQVDSDVFTDSHSFPTRGYDIDPDSFSLVIGPAEAGLQDPIPGGQTAYFVLRDDDPAVDGFWTSTNVDFPLGVPTDVAGILENFRLNFQVTYTGDTLESLDILDALGTYDFAGLTVFHLVLEDGGLDAMGMIFEQLVISTGPTLEISGVCPGEVTFDIGGATPNSLVALLSGAEGGPSVLSGGPCDGVRLPIGDPTGRRTVSTDAGGKALLVRDIVNPATCAPTIVALDLATCAVSNPAGMP